MELQIVPPSHIDFAWRDGAFHLDAACAKSAGEMTESQLKMQLARGEWTLLAGVEDGRSKAWAVVGFQQNPNCRALWIQAIYAPGATTDEAMTELRKYAVTNGCSTIRGACNEAVQRLWERRFKAKRLYAVVEIDALK